ncbi:pseudouridylate synthase 7 homolog-like protein isoform X5 [Scyliorhinus canicula]|uniref:pseudouridylate synthase 7 homolog-like protein isoform X5 n=1 Tax=Scyliorhinus canicula TaxID=7830 RepID=UPI0018F3961B|nr:pseudouridylate synthase 7 homolog-like protein isoform X5 [Scyliorhinus canicula]
MKEFPDSRMDGLPFHWVSDHTGFCGTIKNSASDFMVTEIDVHGQLVSDAGSDCSQDSCNTENEQEMAHPSCNKRLKRQEKTLENFPELPKVDKSKDANVEHSKINQTADRNVSESAPNSPSVQASETLGDTLDLLLGTSVAEMLETFALAAKERKPAEGEGTAEEAIFSLGTFPEKSQRAAIHSAVRQKFPFLKTATNSAEIQAIPDPQYLELCQLVTEEEANGFFCFLDSKDRSSKFMFHPDGNKEHRKAVHHLVSKCFGKLVETKSFSAQEGDGHQGAVITVRFRDKIISGRKRHANDCGAVPAIYTAFTLCKVNMETLEAVAYLASELGVVPSDFSYAGIKDKKAITSQTMVVRNVTINRLKATQLSIQSKGLKVYNLRPATQHLHVGQLKGNHFSIVIRNISKHQEDDPDAILADRVLEAIEKVKEKGFVNYYGPQRFGLGQNVQADQIGLALLKETLQVHVVTAEDLKSNVYSINQVVLPMPGNNIQYPCNELASWYQEALARDGLKACKFRIPALQLNIPGCYRRLLAQPQQLVFHWLESKDVPSTNGDCGLDTGESKQPQKMRDSLSLSFSLNSSCYATVCLREIMKCNV